jgi:hypothetical protein
MEQGYKKILVVEDTEENMEAAKAYFKSKGIEALYAKDYDEAMAILESDSSLEGVITDCFFPKKTGSGDRTLGEKVIKEKLARGIAHSGKFSQEELEKFIKESILDQRDDIIAEFGKYVKLEGKVKELVQKYAEQCIVYDKKPQIIDIISKLNDAPSEKISEIVVSTLKCKSFKYEHGRSGKEINWIRAYGQQHKKTRSPDEIDEKVERHEEFHFKMKYAILMDYLRESESQQPLGVLVAEEAAKRGIPAVIASSLSGHGSAAEIVSFYFGMDPSSYGSEYRDMILSCMGADEKDRDSGWEWAYHYLQRVEFEGKRFREQLERYRKERKAQEE